ncbi:MAG: T9SS C-terminal target domain-containing protein [Flavobacteriales bacterium]|nr:MAG: T9SS C-terminal target domain-containing protein [Flavobacteriales bacterium]
MTLVAGLGLCQPFDYCCDPRTWNGAIHYGTSACSDIRTPVTPTASDSVQANFTWNTISHTVSFQNTSLNADSVVWFFDTLGTAAGDSVTFQFPQTDSFEVCMIAYNSCGSDTICQMVWAENISVERFGELLDLRLFPNPNNGTFTLSFLQHLKGDLRVEIIDLSGRVLLNQLYTNHQGAFDNTYDLNHLASGMYQLRLSSPDGTTMRSFVISR